MATLFPPALPALSAGLIPLLFIPISVDAYVLPRAALVIVIASAAALIGIWSRRGGRPGLGELGPLALAVAVAALVATAFSVSPTLSLIGSYGRYESLPMRLAYLLLFCLPVWTLRTARQRWWTVTFYLVGCTIVSLEAIHQAHTGLPPRPDGNLGHANLLSALLAMAVPLVVVRALRSPAWTLCLLPLGTALVTTSSRSGWLGALAAVTVLVPLLTASARARRLTLAGAGLAIVAGGVLIVASPLGRLHSDTGAARLHVWSDSLAMIAARPIFGWGPESQGLVLGSFLRGDWEPGVTFDRIHQMGLDLLATQGLAGLTAAALLWGAWALGCWRATWPQTKPSREGTDRRHELAGLLGAWAGYLVVASLNFDWLAATAPLWLLAGVAWAAVRSVDAAGVPDDTDLMAARRGGSRVLIAVAASLVPLSAMVGLAALPLAADLAYFRRDAISATHLDPLQPRYHQALGEQLAGQNQAAQAVIELEAARRLGNSDSSALVSLGDAYAALGDRPRARAAYEAALKLNRYDPIAARRLAE